MVLPLDCLLIRAQDQVKSASESGAVADQTTGSIKRSGLDSGLSADRSSVPGDLLQTLDIC
jgi:hypothetical protein